MTTLDPLRGLDRSFFLSCLRKDKDDEFTKKGRKASPSPRGTSDVRQRMETNRTRDFDVYLGESVLPLLAQALEALSKKMQRMSEGSVKEIEERFHPLTWLAQYMIRQHPKHVQSPRRRKVYDEFSSMANLERGRREILRRKLDIQAVFRGFEYNRKVQKKDYAKLFDAFDERFRLHGALKSSPLLNIEMLGKQIGPTCDFDQFWGWFLRWILRNDVIKFSSLAQGEYEAKALMIEKQRADEKKRLRQEAAQKKKEAEDLWWTETTEVIADIKGNEDLQKLLNDKYMMLTGVVKQSEDEIPPMGPHVYMLTSLLHCAGFPIDESVMMMKEFCVWDNARARAWSAWQEYNEFDLVDGVVEQVSLSALLQLCEDRESLLSFKMKAPMLHRAHLENKTVDLEGMADDAELAEEDEGKPTYRHLCENYGLTMARLEWLHDKFEEILGGKDNYPDDPTPLSKEQMFELMASIKPDMTIAAFEEYFIQIDTDGSGKIEFDEFVEWLSIDEASLMMDLASDGTSEKPSFEKLAARFHVDVSRIHAMHKMFCEYFEDGVTDGYPDDPLALTKDVVREILLGLNENLDEEDFLQRFEWIDFDGSGKIEFDEFLDFLDCSIIEGKNEEVEELEEDVPADA